MTQKLQRFHLAEPGVDGLALEGVEAEFDPRSALELTNAVFDKTGKLAAREGYTEWGTSHAADVISIAEFKDEGNFKTIVHSTATDIWEEGSFSFSSFTNVKGTASGGNYQFATMNLMQYAIKDGTSLISRAASATFATQTASSGSVPNGNCLIAAYGRLWATNSDDYTVKWSGSLDGGNWGGAGSGTINMRTVVQDDLDTVVALAAFQNRFVVFMTRHIVTFIGTEDPATLLETEDIITNIGAAPGSRDCVVSVGNDILFFASDGLRSLRRAIEQGDRLPLSVLSSQISTELQQDYSAAFSGSYPYLKATYSRRNKFYILQLGPEVWMFDLQRPTADNRSFRVSKWESLPSQGWFEGSDDTLWLGINGGLGQYGGYNDDTDTYQFRYLSSWFQMGDGGGFIPKRALVTTLSTATYPVTFTHRLDFDPIACYEQSEVEVGGGDEYNIAEYNIGEYSGAVRQVARTNFHLTGEGERIQVGMTVTINGSAFSFQSIDLYGKRGRMAA